MMMTDEEIARAYREAKNPNEQINILADLNVVSKRRIIEAIRRGNAVPAAITLTPDEAEMLRGILDRTKQRLERRRSKIEPAQYEAIRSTVTAIQNKINTI